jgi:chromosome segregation ATPase
MNIFNIGKANERITALEAELATAKQELQSEKENATQISTAAEVIKTERDELKTKFTALEASVSAKDEEIKTLKAAQGEFDAKVEARAGKIAADKVAASGLPRPLENKPSEAQVADPAPKNRDFKAEVKPLSGVERLALERK